MDFKKVGSQLVTNNFVMIALIVIVGIAYLRWAPDSVKPWTNAPQPVVQPKEPKKLAKVERVFIEGPERVTVIETIKYLEKVPGVLTPQTANDNNAHIIASAIIPPSPAEGTATGILR